MAHLLVTGGAGYIGSHTVRALLRSGHTAVVFDNMRSGRAELVQDAPLVRGDINDRDAVLRVQSSHGPFDGVLHFAALLSVAESVANPLRYYENNVTGSAALIDAALVTGVRAFVLSSTAAVYGHSEQQPIPETAPLAPINPYGASKLMVERMLADCEKAHGLRWAALRYFNASGADPDGGLGECHEPETHLVPLAIEAAVDTRKELAVFGTDYPTPDGTCVRDYVHVTDLADAHVRTIEALLEGKTVGAANLGSGRGHSIREVLASVAKVVGAPGRVREAARRPGDPAVLVADATRFREQFGWQPRHSDLDTIVGTAWEWLKTWKGLA